MRTPDEYREFAAECYRWAAEAKIEMYRKMMEEMARAWSEVAEELETKIAQQR
jgi:BMFP domain-containing protein YqiC